VAQAVFYVLGAVILLGGVAVVTTRNVVYAALALLATLTGVAGLFVLLYAEFLALVQLLIYGGAIIIVVLFALMLTRTSEYTIATENRRWPFAALASIGLFVLLAVAAIGDSEHYNASRRAAIGIKDLGTGLFEQWAVPFEIASVLLLVALIGAIVIGRSNEGEEDQR
jgi:NADH-quinone oxidoreductase subunit J